MAIIPKNYARLESGYREKALKLFPWVCGRCSRGCADVVPVSLCIQICVS